MLSRESGNVVIVPLKASHSAGQSECEARLGRGSEGMHSGVLITLGWDTLETRRDSVTFASAWQQGRTSTSGGERDSAAPLRAEFKVDNISVVDMDR